MLFDSGGVLLRPIGGRWNPRFDFEDVVRRHHPETDLAALPGAVAAGDAHLRRSPADRPRVDYHRHVLAALGIVDPTEDLLAELDRPRPFHEIVEVYEDARPVLGALRTAGLRLAVVSDAGPELERAYVELRLAPYFEAFAISAVVGVTKPDPRMFDAARSVLGLEPQQCLFVDDAADLVAAAIDLGYQAVCLRRTDDRRPLGPVPTISTLDEVLPLAVG